MVAIKPGEFSCWLLQGEAAAGSGLPDGVRFNTVYLDLPWLGSSEEPRSVTAMPGTYQIQQFWVVRPRRELRKGYRGERCELLFLSTAWPGNERVTYRNKPPSPSEEEAEPGPFGNAPAVALDAGFYVASHSYWRKPASFEAKKGQPNVWTLRLPDELTRAVREKLGAETKK